MRMTTTIVMVLTLAPPLWAAPAKSGRTVRKAGGSDNSVHPESSQTRVEEAEAGANDLGSLKSAEKAPRSIEVGSDGKQRPVTSPGKFQPRGTEGVPSAAVTRGLRDIARKTDFNNNDPLDPFQIAPTNDSTGFQGVGEALNHKLVELTKASGLTLDQSTIYDFPVTSGGKTIQTFWLLDAPSAKVSVFDANGATLRTGRLENGKVQFDRGGGSARTPTAQAKAAPPNLVDPSNAAAQPRTSNGQ